MEHLAQRPGGVQAREPREVDGGLGVARSAEYAALLRHQREHMSRHAHVVGPKVRVGDRTNALCSVERARARRRPPSDVDRDSERRPVALVVLRDHQRDPQLVEPLLRDGHAHDPPPVRDHEVDRLGRSLLGRHDEVALILAIGVVHDDDDVASPDVVEGLLDRRERAGHEVLPPSAPGVRTTLASLAVLPPGTPASCASTYFAITSTSRFTMWPRRADPSVVTASVCGIRATEKPVPSRAATVRLTPSRHTEPFSTTKRRSSTGILTVSQVP